MPQSALIYRRSGDYKPIHASPAIARKAGFEQPILHGLCTMGIATRAILEGVCDQQPERLKSMYVRFSKPVYRSEEHTSELQSLMRISYAVFCLKKKKQINQPSKNNEYRLDKSRSNKIVDL